MKEIMTINNINCYEENGVAYLNAEACARGLGFTQIKNDVEYVRWETVNGYLAEIGFSQQVGKDDYIPENIFYRLAMKAKNETAEKFQAMVADEILPAIRKHGVYMTQEVLHKTLTDPKTLLEIVQNYAAEQERRIALEGEVQRKDQIIGELQPKADYVDRILSTTGTMTVTQIAADYGISAIELNRILYEERVQRKVNGQWILYNEHMGKGYTKSETVSPDRISWLTETKLHTKWTQKGRLFINEILNRRGIYANVDDMAGALQLPMNFRIDIP